MLKMNIWNREIGRHREETTFFTISPFLIIVATAIALLLGGIIIGLLSEGALLGRFGHYIVGAAILSIGIVLLLVLRQYELAATALIGVHVFVDWYLAFYIVGSTMTLALLVIYFLARSPRYPWAEPRALWLWALFLVLALFPAIRGATNYYDEAFYYPNIIFGALLTFWVGTVIARDPLRVKRLFKILAAFGAFIAVHTIIQALTGVFLFETAHYQAYLAAVSNFQLNDSTALRAGSFLENPDWNSSFLAVILFLPLCLFIESTSFKGKLLYLVEAYAILTALLFTYGAGAITSAIVGLIVFIALLRRVSHWVQIWLFIAVGTTVLFVGFSGQVSLLVQHASDPNGLLLRSGAWQTAIRVIQAFPLTGIGLSLEGYLFVTNIYRVPAQYRPLAHPHNSYLELGAMAGIPVLIVFVALILFALWLALRNWRWADIRTRVLLAGGIAAVITLTVNSMTINGWTLPPLAVLGWLILGVVSSPLLAKSRDFQRSTGWRQNALLMPRTKTDRALLPER